MLALWLGTVDYAGAWRLQRELAAMRASGGIGDVLLLLEHPPTITLGRGADPRHVLASRERLAALGVALFEIDRGGDVTYHGPGQLVGYPIFDLASGSTGRDLHAFLRAIEEALILALGDFGLEGSRRPPHTGVWVGERKIAAIGIKVSRWVSTHGFALNVAPDMSHFGMIVPCGIREYGVTSLTLECGKEAPCVQDAACRAAAAFGCVFLRDSWKVGTPGNTGADPVAALHRRLGEFSEPSRKILERALDTPGWVC